MNNQNKSKPSIFVASSSEGLYVAYDLQEKLSRVADLTVWDQDVFRAGQYIMDELDRQISSVDFGIFIFGFEDIAIIREEAHKVSRDNVIFELGLFAGKLGRDRCFIVQPSLDEKIHLPSDLLGITTLSYDASRNNSLAAVGPVCNQITRIIGKKGPIGSLEFIGSKRTPKNLFLKSLIEATLETACRGIGVPWTPHDSRLRAFIFRKVGKDLICSHNWAQNPVKEAVGILKFNLNDEKDADSTIIRAAKSRDGAVIRKVIDPIKQKELSERKQVKSTLKLVLAAPIYDVNGDLWGVVDFNTSNDKGEKILNTEEAEALVHQLTQHLKLIFSIDT